MAKLTPPTPGDPPGPMPEIEPDDRDDARKALDEAIAAAAHQAGYRVPLILTLALDPRLFAGLDALRRTHFPPERNVLPAHLTLFHALPGEHEFDIADHLRAVCDAHPPVPLLLPGVRSLGKGVAVTVDAPELAALRNRLARQWATWLTPQDRQGFRPHVTVQNKVTPAEAKALHAELAATWAPVTGTGDGLLLWRYVGGPWEPAGEFRFGG